MLWCWALSLALLPVRGHWEMPTKWWSRIKDQDTQHNHRDVSSCRRFRLVFCLPGGAWSMLLELYNLCCCSGLFITALQLRPTGTRPSLWSQSVCCLRVSGTLSTSTSLFGLGAIFGLVGSAQCFWLYSEITPGRIPGPYGMPGFNLGQQVQGKFPTHYTISSTPFVSFCL